MINIIGKLSASQSVVCQVLLSVELGIIGEGNASLSVKWQLRQY